MRFFAAELDLYAPALPGSVQADALGTHPRGALSQITPAIGSSETLRVSDLGYRTREADPSGVAVYLPRMTAALSIDRRINLDPAASGAAAAWGALTVSNAGQAFDSLAASRNSDGRAIRVYTGRKTYDPNRGYWVDPAWSALGLAFAGISLPWQLSESELVVPLRDASYWLERPLQQATYTGGGGYGGSATLTGVPLPKARGGTNTYPIPNVSPVAIDPTNRIYQYNDGPGTIVTLYERGAAVFTYAGDTANLYSGSTPAGQYRTDNSRGLFQLGSTPAGAITADVTGAFPVAGAKSNLFDILYYLLTEDLALPSGYYDAASFTAAAAAYPYTAGHYFGPQTVDGAAAVGQVAASAGAHIYPTRSGALAVLVLRAPGVSPADTWTPAQIVAVSPLTLPAPLSPPPYRWRVGYSRNWTVQTSDLAGAVTDARRQILASESLFAAASNGDIITQYRRPSDPDPLLTSLLIQSEAAAIAAAYVALWSTRRRLYAVTIPAEIGITREIGQQIALRYPLDDLASGRVGVLVGEQYRSGDAVSTWAVLV